MSDRYEIIKLLGKGRTGGVYEAEDTTLGRKVALRRFFAQTKATDLAEYKADFENVARSLSALQHPNLLRVYDAGVDNDGAYIISQLLSGETLQENIKNGPLPILEAQDLALQMLDALSTAHNEGFVHGAITPGSILMTPRARGGYLYVILDMGLSRLAPLIQGKDSFLSIMADPAILAPELFDGGIAEERADLYMLGQIVYMCIAGGHPFGGVGAVEAEILHKNGLPSLLNYNPDVPEDFLRWIEHLTQVDPANRPESAVEALNSLPKFVRPGKTQLVTINAAVSQLNLAPTTLNLPAATNPYAAATQLQSPLGNVTGPLTGVVPAGSPAAALRQGSLPVFEKKESSKSTVYLVSGLVAAIVVVIVLISSSGDDKEVAKTDTSNTEDDTSQTSTKRPSDDSELSYAERNATKEEKIIITHLDGTKPAAANPGWTALDSKVDSSGGWLVKKGIKFPLASHVDDLFDLGWKLTYVVRPTVGVHKFGLDFDENLNPGWKSGNVSLYLELKRQADGKVELSARDAAHQMKSGKSISVPYCGDTGWHTVVIEQKPQDEAGNYTVSIDGKPAFSDTVTEGTNLGVWKNQLFNFAGGNAESEWVIKELKLETL